MSAQRIAVLLASSLVVHATTTAQWSMDGYVVTFPSMQVQASELASMTSSNEQSAVALTRLRLRPSFELSPETFVRLEYEAAASYASSAPEQFSQTRPRGQVADVTWTPHDGSRWTISHGIDRLFVRSMLGPFDLTIGRQRIAWGAGRTWNPTDLFNPIHPASYNKVEKDGVDAVQATARIGDLSDVSVVWNPQRAGRSSGAARARTNWEGVDAAVMAGRFEDRWILGGDLTGSLLDAGLRCEGIVVVPPSGQAFTRISAGLDRQFTGRWYGMAEFFFNGEGRGDPIRYDLGGLMSGKIIHLARRYFILQSSYLLHPLVTAQASTLRNLDDGSGFAGGTISISVTDEASVAVGGQLTFGRTFSEYWYYPQSLYLRADLFF